MELIEVLQQHQQEEGEVEDDGEERRSINEELQEGFLRYKIWEATKFEYVKLNVKDLKTSRDLCCNK